MGEDTGIRLGIVRGISHGVFAPPVPFMPALRALGAGLVRVFITWNQVEPSPGVHEWSAVDALLAELQPEDEVWLTVVSASRWATQQPTDFLPASMPRDRAAWEIFVGALVAHCNGRVRYWQCNNEPSNPGLWSGSAAEYAALAASFARIVRQADPKARIVLGGCGHDVLSAPADAPPRAFFAEVLKTARADFDLFDVHHYDDPRSLPAHLAVARDMLAAAECGQPVVVGEYGGPTLLGFPELEPVMGQIMGEAFAAGAPALDSAELAAAGDERPDRRAMRRLYDKMAELPPAMQMFMQGCPPALEAKRHRIACREVVTRTLLLLADGIDTACYWNLAPEVPNYRDRFNLMGFLSDKLALMDFVHGDLRRREPAADAFERLTTLLAPVTGVRRRQRDDDCVLLEIAHPDGPVLALWREGDAFSGEDRQPALVELEWDAPAAQITDVFGARRDLAAQDGRLSLAVGVTPLFVTR